MLVIIIKYCCQATICIDGGPTLESVVAKYSFLYYPKHFQDQSCTCMSVSGLVQYTGLCPYAGATLVSSFWSGWHHTGCQLKDWRHTRFPRVSPTAQQALTGGAGASGLYIRALDQLDIFGFWIFFLPFAEGSMQIGPCGPTVRGPTVHPEKVANWAPRPSCPGPNCPPWKSGKLGTRQLGPGAQLSGAQLSGAQLSGAQFAGAQFA